MDRIPSNDRRIIVGRDYKNFMRILASEEPGEPTLFEPFIHTRIAEQLLWRRGEHLWNTPEAYIDTIFSLGELTVSDVIVADARLFPGNEEALFRTMVKHADDRIRFVCLCNTEEAVQMADRCGAVCAIGVYGSILSTKPTICMDGTPDDAIRQGAAGWFAANHGEEYWNNYCDRIAILGGLGTEYISSTGPASIHKRCERIYQTTDNRRYALGSGGCLSDCHYLEFISMLGIYKRYKF